MMSHRLLANELGPDTATKRGTDHIVNISTYKKGNFATVHNGRLCDSNANINVARFLHLASKHEIFDH